MNDVELARVINKSIEGVSDVYTPHPSRQVRLSRWRRGVQTPRERYEIQFTLSDGSELLILNPENVRIKDPTVCPTCGHSLEIAR